MEANNYPDNNVHQLYPGGTTTGSIDGMGRVDTIREREGWGVMLEKLSTDMTNLWERQSRLISTEINEKVTILKGASGAMVVGGSLMFVGVFCLAATAILALCLVVQPWIAAAIVTVVLMAIGFIMVKGAQKKLAGKGLVPNQSIEAIGQIKNTFQERIHEFKRQ